MPFRRALTLWTLSVGLAFAFSTGRAAPTSGAAGSAGASWIATWGAAQTAPYGTETVPAGSFNHVTLRQVVHVSVGGSVLRVRVSNVFGDSALQLVSVRIAHRAATADPHAAVITGPAEELYFHGHTAVTVPMGAEYLSDPIPFDLAPLSDLVIDMEIAAAPDKTTMHAGARATSYQVSGDHAGETVLRGAASSTRWYFLSGVQVEAGHAPAGTIVVLGDSITDGHASTTDGNTRWTDFLAKRLAANPATRRLGLVNAGIGGNHLLYDGIGPDALSRLDRDVLARPGVRYLVVLEGINDIGGFDQQQMHAPAEHAAWVGQLETALAEIAEQAHEHGILVYAGTVMPFMGNSYYHPSAQTDEDRVALNRWIETSHTFNAVIPFAAAMADPSHPERLAPDFDSGDHLHPGPNGYRYMGAAVPLDLFTRQDQACAPAVATPEAALPR